MLKLRLYFIFLMASTLCFCSTPETKEVAPPNLVLIIADDMAWNDCGAYGHPNILTPNIDQLAAGGIRFNQAFLTISSCSPSRASIITGLYPHQTDAEQLHWPLPKEQITFVEQLKSAGYYTAQAGKWHLGEEVADRFDRLYQVGTSGFVLSDKPEVKAAKYESGCEDWVRALQERPTDRPFFMWLAAVDPHRPYQQNIIENPHRPEDVIVPAYLPDIPEVRYEFALYYDEITRLDDYVGAVVRELDQQGVRKNTLILFISDNGRPFPLDKTTIYDGGIKTPWIVNWPGFITKGSVCNELVSSIDIAPTFLSLAGLAVGANFEGKDFTPMLQDPQNSIREVVYAEDHWHDFEDQARAVRTKEYKYIRNYYQDLPNTPSADILRGELFQSILSLKQNGQLAANTKTMSMFEPRAAEELYDVINDPDELKNLAHDPDYAMVLETMRDYLSDWQSNTEDIIPEIRTPDEFTRDTGEPLPARKRPRASKKEMYSQLGIKN